MYNTTLAPAAFFATFCLKFDCQDSLFLFFRRKARVLLILNGHMVLLIVNCVTCLNKIYNMATINMHELNGQFAMMTVAQVVQ